MTTPIRLQRYLADRGLGSRRRCEQLIRDGRVKVNGIVVTELGTKVSPERDRVEVRGEPLARETGAHRTILLYKPRGYTCTRADTEGRTVYDLLEGADPRLVSAGRLDRNSEGLLILSTDGDLVNRLTHPRYQHEKRYRVTVSGTLDRRTLDRLRSRLVLDGYRIQPARVREVGEGDKPGRRILEFVLTEGRNRQVRKMCDLAGLTVHRLVRTRIGHVTARGLTPGQWREATPAELASLRAGLA